MRFDYEKLSAGHAKRCGTEGGSELVSCGAPRSSTVRIVDPETRIENPAGKVGEIWLHGDNVASGYWRNPQQTERTFGAKLVDPSPGTPQGPWLRTGDLGVMSEGELFIIGRIKDLLIVDGRNHYPDDIEATIQEITGGRVAAISIPDDRSEQLVAIVELKKRGGSDEEALDRLRTVKREVTSAISMSHSVRVADLVLVPPGSIPITTSGKVRRSACVERYRQDEFSRLDVTRMTAAFDEAALRHWLVDYLVTNIGCSPDEIDFDASLHDLAVGSRDAVVLSGELSELLGRPVSPVEFWQHPTINALARFLDRGGTRIGSRGDGEPRSGFDGRADRRDRSGMPLPGRHRWPGIVVAVPVVRAARRWGRCRRIGGRGLMTAHRRWPRRWPAPPGGARF